MGASMPTRATPRARARAVPVPPPVPVPGRSLSPRPLDPGTTTDVTRTPVLPRSA